MPKKRQQQDYPRVCGGTSPPMRQVDGCDGLSPRVRGNPRNECADVRLLRTIPACAGEPTSSFQPLNEGQDYPRVCGGTSISISPNCWLGGLSPRVRGNPGYTAPCVRV